MRKCWKGAAPGAVWGALLCAFTAAAWGGPVIIPVPSTSTAASTPKAAYGSPAAGTSAAPAAASAQAAPKSAAPAAAPPPPDMPPPPKPKGPDYSHLDVAGLLVQPFGHENVGHGERVSFSYALSDGAFVVLDGVRHDSVGQVQRDFDVGVGIDTTDDPSRSYYAIVDWTGMGILPTGGSGKSGHGYALAGGVRVLPLQSVELYAQMRYDSNSALDGHSSGEIGVLYDLRHSLWLGVSMATTSQENDYLLTLRWDY